MEVTSKITFEVDSGAHLCSTYKVAGGREETCNDTFELCQDCAVGLPKRVAPLKKAMMASMKKENEEKHAVASTMLGESLCEACKARNAHLLPTSECESSSAVPSKTTSESSRCVMPPELILHSEYTADDMAYKFEDIYNQWNRWMHKVKGLQPDDMKVVIPAIDEVLDSMTKSCSWLADVRSPPPVLEPKSLEQTSPSVSELLQKVLFGWRNLADETMKLPSNADSNAIIHIINTLNALMVESEKLTIESKKFSPESQKEVEKMLRQMRDEVHQDLEHFQRK
jgi:hypothetical protein